MSLRLRPSVNCVAVDDGVLFRVWDDQFLVKGPPSLSRLCSALLIALQQDVSVERLRETLPPAALDVALGIVEELSRRGGLLDTNALSVTALTADLRERYRGTIAFLESRVPDPYAAFLTFHGARVHISGNGDALAAIVRALAGMGLASLDCACPVEERDAILLDLADQPACAVSFVADAGAEGGNFDLRIRIQTAPDVAGIDWPARATDQRGGAQLEAVLTPAIGLVAPVSTGRSTPGLADLIFRLRHQPEAQEPDGHQFGSPVAARLLGNVVAFEALKHLCAVTSPSDGKAAVVTPSSLECAWHAIEPVAELRNDDDSAEDVRAALRLFQTAEPQTADTFLERFAGLTDRHFGWFDDPHPRHLPQIPVSLALTGSTDPAVVVIGAGGDEDAARHQAAIEIVRWWATELADPDTIRAVDVVTGATSELARPAMQLAAGHSYDEWLLDGLHRLAAAEVACSLDDRFQLALQPLRFEHVVDTEARWLWKSLALRFGRSVEVVRAQARACPYIHVAHIVERGTSLALGTGASALDALRAAMLTALARAQLEQAGENASNLPVFRRSAHVAVSGSIGNAATAGPPDLSLCIRGLARAGVIVTAAPWDREPAVRRHGLLLGWIGLDERH